MPVPQKVVGKNVSKFCYVKFKNKLEIEILGLSACVQVTVVHPICFCQPSSTWYHSNVLDYNLHFPWSLAMLSGAGGSWGGLTNFGGHTVGKDWLIESFFS